MKSDHSKLEVLIVDDEPVMLKMIEYGLKAIGIKNVTIANNGQMACDLVEISNEPFDIILCDWNMPGMNGLEFLKKLRADGNKTKFIMLTGNASPENVKAAVEAGANSYLAKPFTPQDLHKRVKLIVKSLST